MRKLNKKGFTLIELLAVIVILAIIIMLVFPQITNVMNGSKVSTIHSKAKGLVEWWNTTEQALDIDNLKKDETFILSLNGEDFNGEWDYFIENNSLMISMQIPEPSTYAAIFGALAIAFAAYRRRK